MVHRGVSLLLVVVLGMSFMFSIGTIDVMKPTEIIGNPRTYEISYDSHAPFNITSNSDFETQSWPGNGSAVNPYLIQNLNITSTDFACIWIANTTSHFIIEDCLFSTSGEGYQFIQPIGSLTFTNVSNGIVERNQIVDSDTAVSGYGLSNCSISDNSFNVSVSGVYLYSSNSTMISNNTQGYKSSLNGLTVAGCRNCTISLNEFQNITSVGIFAYGSNYDVHIVENSFRAFVGEYSSSWGGIQLSGELCTIQRNVLLDFGFSGIDVSGRNHTVKDNDITSVQTVGIVARTNNSTITANNINGSFNGIEMVQANDTMVHDNFIVGRRAYETGIVIYGGYDCDIYSNDISQIAQGIYLQGATRANVSSNTVTEGRYGFVFGWYTNWGLPEGQFFDCDIVNNAFDSGGVFPRIEHYENWNFDTIRFDGNTVHGDPIGFFTNLDQETIDGNAYGQLLLYSCNEITISGGNFHDISSDRWHDIYFDAGEASAITLVNCTACDLTNIDFRNNTYGIVLQNSFQCNIIGGTHYYNSRVAISVSDSEDIDISNADIRNNPTGVEIRLSYECSISDCQINDNEEGIVLQTALNCTLSHNTILQNNDGIFMDDSDGSEILSNAIYLNQRGVLLNSTSECMITQNNIYNNTGVGIALDTTANRNEIYNNTFAYNSPNAICEGSSNHWDNQIDTGNRWSDYSGEGPYIIDENDQDNFPFAIETTTTNGTTTIGTWDINPVLLGIVGGSVGIVAIAIIVAYRQRKRV